MSNQWGAYGNHKWTCGECGDSYEASGVTGDSKVDRWMHDHKEKHRVEKLPQAEQDEYWRRKIQAQFQSMACFGSSPPENEQGSETHGEGVA